MATPTKRPEATTPQGQVTRRSREEGISKILEPAESAREGARLTIFGRTRFGKSAFAVSLLDEMLARGIASTAIVHDVKYPDRQQYVGAAVTDQIGMVQELQTSSVVVCRPPFPAESAAAWARELAADHGEPTVLLVDETRRALGNAQRWVDNSGPDGKANGPKNFEWLLLEGGGLRASLVLLVQIPRQLPGDAVDSAQFAVVFGLGGRSLNYLVQQGTVPAEAVDTVKALDKGEFCVFSDDEEWDRTIYYSPLPTMPRVRRGSEITAPSRPDPSPPDSPRSPEQRET